MLRGVRKLRPLRFHAPNGGNHTQKTPSGGLLNTTAFGRGRLLRSARWKATRGRPGGSVRLPCCSTGLGGAKPRISRPPVFWLPRSPRAGRTGGVRLGWCEVAIDKVLEVVSGDPVSLRWAQALGPDCGKKGDIVMVEVLFPPVTRRARNKNKSEMNRCLPTWLSRPTSHQPMLTLPHR